MCHSEFKPGGYEADWAEEAEDMCEDRLFVFEFFSDAVCFDCGFPSAYP